ncbi:transcription intermediary factor 1-beta-like isoform X1 [Haliotis rufescens]|uniref:transcription intermediary factor 1-beta-like isoform X1 n=2 Tax=Haliotis rufescens TaxID=6454 RepID=UPI00201F3BF0|nr:transcription intermediary factor 1-beta-like isoform X1 [Haliotis rufescens]
MYRTLNFIPSIHSEIVRMNHDDLLGCSFCEQKYAVKRRDPRLLRCLHAICEPCLQQHGDLRDTDCKTCSAEQIGREGIPVDYVHRNELILYMAKHAPERLQCTNKLDGNKGKVYCFECNHFLCDQCESYHAQLESTMNHISVDLGDLTSHPLTEQETKQKCSSHPDYPVVFYCRETSCRKLICLYCYTKEHSGHDTQDIDDAYDEEKERLKSTSNRLDSKITSVKALEPITRKASEQRQRIHDAFENIRISVSDRQRHHQQLLNYHYGAFRQTSNENLMLLREQITRTMDYYYQAMSFFHDPEYEVLEGGIPLKTDTTEPMTPDSDLVFVQVGLANLLQDIRTFGKVNKLVHESNC